jgi:hypothetical protein
MMAPAPPPSSRVPPPDVLASGNDEPPRALPRWAKALGAAAVAAAAAAVLLPRAADVLPPAPLDARLAVDGDAVQVTLDGILVVPVSLTSPGTALTVRSAELTAAPVRSTPEVRAPQVVTPGDPRRLVAIVAPDCTVIGPGIGGELVATVVVAVVAPDGRAADLRLSFGSTPVLRERLAGLCGGGQGAARRPVTIAEESRELGLVVRQDLAGGSAGG